MSDYQVGKDIGGILVRLDAIERKLGCGCGGSSQSSAVETDECVKREHDFPLIAITNETKRDETAGMLVESKSWSFDVDRLGDCELRAGASLTLFSDGRYRAIGSRKCNAGGFKSCKQHKICVAFFRDGDSDCSIEVGRFVVADGLLGPGSESGFQKDGSDNVLRDLYESIRCAAFWVNSCQTGL